MGPGRNRSIFRRCKIGQGLFQQKGFKKLEGFCKVAASANCHYAWLDTCCIDKGNLVELSEAINSMYRWYQGSKICIVYLEDVPQKQLTESV